MKMKKRRMKTDTAIRHVTKPGADLFVELGFPTEEAHRLQADAELRKKGYPTLLQASV